MSSFPLSLMFLARLMNQRVLFTKGSLLSSSPMVWTNTSRMLKENGVSNTLSRVKRRMFLVNYPRQKPVNFIIHKQNSSLRSGVDKLLKTQLYKKRRK